MLETLIITLREGIEAALAVGIVLIHLRRTDRRELQRPVFWGLGAALVASLAGAFVLSRLPAANEELFEGVLMMAAACLVVSMVVWMWRHGRRLKSEIEQRVGRIATQRSRLMAAAGLFLFTFLMVFREGVETVILLAAVNLTTDALLAFIGGLAGLGLAVLFGVAFVKGSLRVDLARFFKITGIVLLIFAAQLAVGGIHELAEAGLLPIGRREMGIVGPIVKAQGLFLAALLALPVLLLFFPGRAPLPAPAAPLPAPERRLLAARARRERLWKGLAGSAGLVVIASLTVSHAFARLPRAVDPPRMLVAQDGPAGAELRLPAAEFEDGSLHRFGVEIGGRVVRFFLLRPTGGELTASFDACEICGASGYIQEGLRLVCLNCAADIVPATVGLGGGCNPIPLASRRQGGEIVVRIPDLEAQADLFPRAAGAH